MSEGIIVALVAIIAPVVTTLINGLFQKAEREANVRENIQKEEKEHSRLIELHIRTIYTEYLQNTSKCIAYPDDENMKEYGRGYAIAFAYFPKNSHAMLKEINESIEERNFIDARKRLEELSIWISDLMLNEINGYPKERQESSEG